MATTIEMAKKLQAQKLTKGQAETIAIMIRDNNGEFITKEYLKSSLEKFDHRITNNMLKWCVPLILGQYGFLLLIILKLSG